MAVDKSVEDEAFKRLKAELDLAFAQPDDSYRALEIEEVIDRNRRRYESRPHRGRTPP